ncbi:MAG: lipid-A-disaccharide synthase [Bacteroidota bacterium]
MKYYIIAGEASGDLHASNLMKALAGKDPQANYRFWGGDLMQAVGGKLVKHYRDLAFMGLIEVLKNIRTIFKNLRFCKEDILAYQPDALILVDYPGFNLRIAKWAHKKGIKVFYYISPQLWAWNSKRVHGIKRSVDYMYVILPFEKDFYEQYDYKVDFVGHPLLDAIKGIEWNEAFRQKNQLDERPIVALLPGSRRQEINKMLEIMLTVVDRFKGYQFVIGGAPSIPLELYQAIIGNRKNVAIVQGQTYDLMQHAKAALVTSGTTTLETGLFRVPQIVCYKGNPLFYQIAKRIVNVKYIALVNLILDRPLVKELIQHELNTDNLAKELQRLIDPANQAYFAQGYEELHAKLGHEGASERTAELIVKALT